MSRYERETASAARFGSTETDCRISANAAGISFCRNKKLP